MRRMTSQGYSYDLLLLNNHRVWLNNSLGPAWTFFQTITTARRDAPSHCESHTVDILRSAAFLFHTYGHTHAHHIVMCSPYNRRPSLDLPWLQKSEWWWCQDRNNHSPETRAYTWQSVMQWVNTHKATHSNTGRQQEVSCKAQIKYNLCYINHFKGRFFFLNKGAIKNCVKSTHSNLSIWHFCISTFSLGNLTQPPSSNTLKTIHVFIMNTFANIKKKKHESVCFVWWEISHLPIWQRQRRKKIRFKWHKTFIVPYFRVSFLHRLGFFFSFF